MPRHHRGLLLLVLPLTLAATCRRNNNEIIEPPVDPIEVQVEQLQVVSIDPAWSDALQPFSATVYGSGFDAGARVRLDEGIEVSRVTVVDGNRLTVTMPPLEVGSYDVWVLNTDGETSVLRNGLTIQDAQDNAQPDCAQATLYFDFDSDALSPESRTELMGLVACLMETPGTIRLEGHCDERGTTEYNLALGQRRAETVRSALMSEGLAPSRISTVSYGEESPADRGHDERAWSLNRRVELEVSR